MKLYVFWFYFKTIYHPTLYPNHMTEYFISKSEFTIRNNKSLNYTTVQKIYINLYKQNQKVYIPFSFYIYFVRPLRFSLWSSVSANSIFIASINPNPSICLSTLSLLLFISLSDHLSLWFSSSICFPSFFI